VHYDRESGVLNGRTVSSSPFSSFLEQSDTLVVVATSTGDDVDLCTFVLVPTYFHYNLISTSKSATGEFLLVYSARKPNSAALIGAFAEDLA
jgi:hypothetical protein